MLKIQTSKARFNKLVKKVASKKVRQKILRLFTEEIAEESKKYITQGKVQPELRPSTIRNRRKRGVTNQKPLLFKKGLRDSIKGTDDGVEFADYGKYHRRRGGYIAWGKVAVPQREFIAYHADDGVKKRIKNKVKRRYMEEINK
tara:strand:+ start:1810 stop:2241 length:432 start_codon:yes stop_codon:yes gene_type:complete